jgi:hypothetical protein
MSQQPRNPADTTTTIPSDTMSAIPFFIGHCL